AAYALAVGDRTRDGCRAVDPVRSDGGDEHVVDAVEHQRRSERELLVAPAAAIAGHRHRRLATADEGERSTGRAVAQLQGRAHECYARLAGLARDRLLLHDDVVAECACG